MTLTDGVKCINQGCPYQDESFEFSCSKGEDEPFIEKCPNSLILDRGTVWIKMDREESP